MYPTLKLVHMTTAVISISGFALRGIWMLIESPLLDKPLTRILPHINDSVFLLSGIGLVWTLGLPVVTQPWLLAKLAVIVAYVVLGAIALRRGRTRTIRILAFVFALLSFFYIAGVARTKSMESWLALLAG